MLSAVNDIADAAIAADRVMNAMKAEFVVDGHTVGMSCSIGVSVFPEQGLDGVALIKNAELAMYSAREAGRNNVRFSTPVMNAEAAQRLSLEHDLRLALDRDEFFLVYQPQIPAASLSRQILHCGPQTHNGPSINLRAPRTEPSPERNPR